MVTAQSDIALMVGIAMSSTIMMKTCSLKPSTFSSLAPRSAARRLDVVGASISGGSALACVSASAGMEITSMSPAAAPSGTVNDTVWPITSTCTSSPAFAPSGTSTSTSTLPVSSPAGIESPSPASASASSVPASASSAAISASSWRVSSSSSSSSSAFIGFWNRVVIWRELPRGGWHEPSRSRCQSRAGSLLN